MMYYNNDIMPQCTYESEIATPSTIKMRDAFPILTCEEARAFESQLLGDDMDKTWNVMCQVGRDIGNKVLRDYLEITELPDAPKILILAGKGHNAGDALLAGAEILRQRPRAEIATIFASGQDDLKPLVRRAWEELSSLGQVRAISLTAENSSEEAIREMLEHLGGHFGFHVCLDGILGVAFVPPLRKEAANLINAVNNYKSIRLRAAVDLPSGLGDESDSTIFKAHFTYTTGIPKKQLFEPDHDEYQGRVRFVNVNFFEHGYDGPHSYREYVLQDSVLDSFRKLRSHESDKRNYGHLYIVSGSRNYPGALLMSVKAALRSGVGLLTVFAPESITSAYAAAVPEAMWVPWPENDNGCLSIKGKTLLSSRIGEASAILMGPGLGKDSETHRLVASIAETYNTPLVLDADALVPDVANAVRNRPGSFGSVIATPHRGEFERMYEGEMEDSMKQAFQMWSMNYNMTTLLKGSISKICHEGTIYNNTFGGPVLARGGSGDILSGLAAGLLAQMPQDPMTALIQATVWQGLAADHLERDKGQVSVMTTDILEYLGKALRSL